MATKAQQLMELAKQAQLAKQEGRAQEFVNKAGAVQSAANDSPDSPPDSLSSRPAPAISTATISASEGATPGPGKGVFASLQRGRLPNIEDQGDMEVVSPNETVPERQPPRPGVGSASPAGASTFAGLARLSELRRQDGGEQQSRPYFSPAPSQTNKTKPPVVLVDDPAWDHPSIPAGSAFTPEEWENARKYGGGPQKVERPGSGYLVMEIRNGGQGILLALPKRPTSQVQKVFSGTKKNPVFTNVTTNPTREECVGTLGPIVSDTFDGCLLLAPSATTTHPNAVSCHMTMRTGNPLFNDIAYRLVRPESQRETHFWLWGSHGSFDMAALGITLPAPAAPELSDEDEKTTRVAREAMRG